MKVVGLIDEDFINYKKASMVIMFPCCDFKCGFENCQNKELTKAELILIEPQKLVDRYINNPITKAVVLGGLEPFDSFEDVKEFLKELNKVSSDPVVIYSGYNKYEIEDKVKDLTTIYPNLIIKFGRYIPEKNKRFDEVLGVWLASDNQYAEEIFNAV